MKVALTLTLTLTLILTLALPIGRNARKPSQVMDKYVFKRKYRKKHADWVNKVESSFKKYVNQFVRGEKQRFGGNLAKVCSMLHIYILNALFLQVRYEDFQDGNMPTIDTAGSVSNVAVTTGGFARAPHVDHLTHPVSVIYVGKVNGRPSGSRVLGYFYSDEFKVAVPLKDGTRILFNASYWHGTSTMKEGAPGEKLELSAMCIYFPSNQYWKHASNTKGIPRHKE